MKRKMVILFMLLLICGAGRGNVTKIITMKEDKITQLIFPATIQSTKGGFLPVDFAITTEDNVLYIQPVGSFSESNINIITADGCYYTFIVKYDEDASIFNFIFSPEEAIFSHQKIFSNTEKNNEKHNPLAKGNSIDQDNICKKILSKKGYLVSGNMAKFKNVSLLIKGVYVDNNNIYLRLILDNRSNINYDLDYLSFSINNEVTKRRSSQQSHQILSTYTYRLPEVIRGKTDAEIVVCFDKFTIGEKKYLEIMMLENNGERNIKLKISNQIMAEAQNYE